MLARVKDGQLQVERARQMLAEAKTIDAAKNIRDTAKAAAVYAREAGASREVVLDAMEIQARAERRCGQMLREVDVSRHNGSAGSQKEPATNLSDLGITKKQSMVWQRAADLPDEVFEVEIASAIASGSKPTTSRIVSKSVRAHDRTASDEPAKFALLLELERVRSRVLSVIEQASARWPAEYRGALVELLRSMAEEMSDDG